MDPHDPTRRLALAACPLLLLVACFGTSRASHFYTLAPAEVGHGEVSLPVGRSAPLAIGPVEIPDYLDRQQIVTRSGDNELVISEFDRWGGSLEREISRSLVATAADRLAPRRILVFPWRSMPPALPTGAYHVSVAISKFDAVLGASVVLRGRWQLVREKDGRRELVAVKEATITEQVGGGGYPALVAAMQRALVALGTDIADGAAAAADLETP